MRDSHLVVNDLRLSCTSYTKARLLPAAASGVFRTTCHICMSRPHSFAVSGNSSLTKRILGPSESADVDVTHDSPKYFSWLPHSETVTSTVSPKSLLQFFLHE